MDIGKEERTIHITPKEDPVPKKDVYERRSTALQTWEDLTGAGIPCALKAQGSEDEMDFHIVVEAHGVDLEEVQEIVKRRGAHTTISWGGVTVGWTR